MSRVYEPQKPTGFSRGLLTCGMRFIGVMPSGENSTRNDGEGVAEMFYVLICAVVSLVGLICGFAVGMELSDHYIAKKICRVCRRTIVEYGFHSDGKEYVAVERDKVKKEV